MNNKVTATLAAAMIFLFADNALAKLTLQEVRAASGNVLVVFFTSDTLDLTETDISDEQAWKINGTPTVSINRYVTKADACDHHIYLETSGLIEGMEYLVETPYGNKEFRFSERDIFLSASVKRIQD